MTIIIDSESCTQCGICSEVCPMGIIDPAVEKKPPLVQKEKSGMCISCGQCEAFCPSGALVQEADNDGPTKASGEGAIPADRLGLYLKSRRSIRCYRPEPVPKDTVLSILDITRFAPSGGNGQPVEWLVVHDPGKVQKVAGLTVEWMRELAKSNHPMSAYAPHLIAAWEKDNDIICRHAPHLLFPHIPEANPLASTDAIIALTHVDIAAPAFGVGTCWAGFVAMASLSYQPLKDLLDLPKGRVTAYAMMVGYPEYKPHYLPRRKSLQVIWK
jgi:nitroreductase/NAD-dependent dihydropyrimidine dehydrogenase PreA subunit